ncbi:MAG TPA: mechanosensitive ion channel domain-containing protein [Candidatus Binatia bacterium]|jgi:small-conductance mechanosensitive channel|nr:mechanosensitive ion channel domain-containing protein [Candidatus Binatia bacterium]
MKCSLQNLFRAGLLLALFLSPERLIAQEPQDAQSPAVATEQPPAVPELADLVPLATSLSGRLASLEKTSASAVDLSRVERQLGEISALVDEYDKQFLALKDSFDQRAGRLPQFKVDIQSAGDTLTGVSTSVTAKVRTLGNLRKAWLAEQKQWNAWQAALLKDEPLEEITTTMTKTQGAIDTALGLLRQQLKPLLAMQEQAGILQNRINTLTAEVEGLISLAHGDVLVDTSPSMFSAQYFSQLETALRAGAQTSLAQVSWPGKSFFARRGWVVVLQGVLSLVLVFVFFRHRQQLEQTEHWRFIAKRPVAASLLVGALSGIVFYERPPAMGVFAFSMLIGSAFVRLLGGMVEGGWRWQFVYGLAILLIMNNLFYAFGLPLSLFRLYIVVAALVSLACCLRWAAKSSHSKDSLLSAWALRLGAVFFAAVLFAELRGEAKLAEFLFVSSLRTLGTALVFGLLRHLVRGGLEWVALSSVSRGVALVSSNVAIVVQRLALLFDVLIGVVILSVLLMTWQVYDSPAEAITGLLSVQATIGSQRITIGLVLMAVGSLGVSYLASWMLQKLLTENVLARRNVETGVSLSVTRLVHYALVSIGFAIALVVLGVDLTKMTLLLSALGVGIGFGLQTIVNNFVCGLILLFERPLRVGDTIELGGQWAKIAKIGLRSTMVRTLDEADVIVPNTDLIANQVTNWTLTDRHAERTIAVGVAYGSDVALVMQTLKECALAHPGVMKSPEPGILFRSFGDSALNFELRAWIADVDNRLQIESELHQEIDRQFRQAGIEIPFPQRDLHLRSVENTNNVAAPVRAPLA